MITVERIRGRRRSQTVALLAALASWAVLARAARADVVAHWTFDVNASDAVGTHHGTPEGGAVISSDGGAIAGQSLVLDGNGDFVRVPYSADFNLTSGTVSLWFRGGLSASQRSLMSFIDLHHGQNHGSQDHGWTVQGCSNNGPDSCPGGSIIFGGYAPALFAVGKTGTNALLNDGVFHHLVATFASGGNARLYVDGVLVDAELFPGISYVESPPLTIGRHGAAEEVGEGGQANARDYLGRIDDVQIYDLALNAGQVQYLFGHPGMTVPDVGTQAQTLSIGDVIVAENRSSTVSIESASGTRTPIPVTLPTGPTSVTMDRSGALLVSEASGTNPVLNVLSRWTSDANGVWTRNVIYGWSGPQIAAPHQLALDANGDYIVAEGGSSVISRISPGGVRTVIYTFAPTANPIGVATDTGGDYIVVEAGPRGVPTSMPVLSRIAQNGSSRTVIFNFSGGSLPHFVAIDDIGRFLVTEHAHHNLVRLTWDGVNPATREVIATFPTPPAPDEEYGPTGIAIDCEGNFVVSDCGLNKLYYVTSGADGGPVGQVTELYQFAAQSCPAGISLFGRNRLHVDFDATGANNGCSWGDAFASVQNALSTANNRNADADVTNDITEIWVAAGTYKPAGQGGSRSATFQLVGGVEVYGGFAGSESSRDLRDPVGNETILSGDLNGDDQPSFVNNAENSYHVVRASSVNTATVLDGFTITAGHANGISADNNGPAVSLDSNADVVIRSCRIERNMSSSTGGGVHVLASNPTFRDCIFRENHNTGSEGGALALLSSSATLIGCDFIDNEASGSGGAIYSSSGSPTFFDCTMSGNSASQGGGMYNLNSSPTVANCTFQGNSSGIGGGIYNSASSPAVANCSFIGNSAAFNAGAMFNGTNSNAIVNNCSFIGNVAVDDGGGVWNSSSNPATTNCTFTMNSATRGGAVFNAANSSPTFTNSILWRNSDSGGMDESAQIHTLSGTPVVNYSLVQGGWSGAGGSGNSASDPLFIDADGADNIVGTDDDDLRLGFASPAVDAGNNAAVPADTADLDGDGNTAEPTPIDLVGIARFIDDPVKADTGAGTPPIVDMGAYERVGVLFVDASASGLNNGSSWVNAFTSLQDALAIATPGTEIWVAKGTYMPDGGYTPSGGAHVNGSGIRTATFELESGVALYGGFAGGEGNRDLRDSVNNGTILSGDLNGDDTDVLCTMNSPDCDSFGGRCVDGSCIMRDNNDENSYHLVFAGSAVDATGRFDGFTITGGNANGSDPNNHGGGMFCDGGRPTVTNCTFTGNSASFDGGGMYNRLNGDAVVMDCAFNRNWASSGGGLYDFGTSSTVINCTFCGNATGGAGGAVVSNGGSASFANSTFSGNATVVGGGGIFNVNGGTPTVTNCTFSGNTATFNGGGVYTTGGSLTVNNSILWGNSDGGGTDESAQIHTDSGTPTVNYSIVQGTWTGVGSNNSASDPFFIDADGADNIPGTEDDDLRLSAGSPAIDSGNTTALPVDNYDLDGDGVTSERISLDLAGKPRVLDDPANG
jgi:predicted outer membrane repeat protein